MSTLRKKDAHLWDRDLHDWYVEPKRCSLALFNFMKFEGPIWDPACGMGRIVESAIELGHDSFGTDLIERSSYCEATFDFLSILPARKFSNIVSNPPFGIAEEFVQRALEIIPHGGKVAMILPLVWMAGFSTKRDWLPVSPLKKVLPISPRPSMPPGAVIVAGEKPGNGTKDFAWFVWEQGFTGEATIAFLNTNTYGYSQKTLKFEVNHASASKRNFAK